MGVQVLPIHVRLLFPTVHCTLHNEPQHHRDTSRTEKKKLLSICLQVMDGSTPLQLWQHQLAHLLLVCLPLIDDEHCPCLVYRICLEQLNICNAEWNVRESMKMELMKGGDTLQNTHSHLQCDGGSIGGLQRWALHSGI
jgi:hypothetical protein